MGIVAFWEYLQQGKVKNWQLIMAVLFLFINTFIFEFYKDIHFFRNLHNFNFPLFDFTGKKVGYYYVFFIGFFLSAAQRRYNDALLLLLCLPIVTTVILPTVIGGGVIMMVVWGWYQRQNLKQIAIQLLPVISIFISIFLFRNRN